MFNRLVFLTALLLFPLASLACANFIERESDYDRLASGDRIRVAHGHWPSEITDGSETVGSHSNEVFGLLPPRVQKNMDFSWVSKPDSDPGMWERKVGELRNASDLPGRNNYAVALIHLGRLDEAVSVLLRLEKEFPGHYSVASNLGTAYDLMGQDVLALEWITKGIERNPDSHDGSEWLHIRILEAKLKMKDNPEWLKTHSVSGLDFGAGNLPEKPSADRGASALPTGNQGQPLSFLKAYDGLGYQLKERLQFVKPADPIVADLLMDYGQGAFFLEGARWSETLMLASQEYGVVRQGFGRRRAAIEEWEEENRVRIEREKMPVALAFFLVSVVLSLVWLKYNLDLRRRKSWSVLNRFCWFILSVAQLCLALLICMLFFFSWMSWISRGDLALLFLGGVGGVIVHFYGTSVAGGRWLLLGGLLLPLAMVHADWSNTYQVLLGALCLSAVALVVQACLRPVWFQKPPQSQVE